MESRASVSMATCSNFEVERAVNPVENERGSKYIHLVLFVHTNMIVSLDFCSYYYSFSKVLQYKTTRSQMQLTKTMGKYRGFDFAMNKIDQQAAQ